MSLSIHFYVFSPSLYGATDAGGLDASPRIMGHFVSNSISYSDFDKSLPFACCES